MNDCQQAGKKSYLKTKHTGICWLFSRCLFYIKNAYQERMGDKGSDLY